MTLRTLDGGALARATLAALGVAAAAAAGDWRLATGCFAAVAALALLHANRVERRARSMQSLATHDPLTGVGNYRALQERLHEVTAADAQRFALLTLDVDHFKAINDAHGHLEGDRLLQEVGRVLRDSVGAGEVARQGGDEFSVLVPEADVEGATMLAERIEAALASIAAADQAPLRASIGVAVYPDDGATPADLLGKADEELRRAKAQRRLGAAAA